MQVPKKIKSFNVNADGSRLSRSIYQYQLGKLISLLYNLRKEAPIKNVELFEIEGKLSISPIYIRDSEGSEFVFSRSLNGMYSDITQVRVYERKRTEIGLSDFKYRIIESCLSYICKPCLSLVSYHQIDYLGIDEKSIVVGVDGDLFEFHSEGGRLGNALKVKGGGRGIKQ